MRKAVIFKINKAFLLLFPITGILSCNLNGPVRLSGHSSFRQMKIYSDNILIYNTSIYPDVTKYVYNNEFILARQKPNRSNFITYLGSDLYTRYTAYAQYLKDSTIFSKNEWKELKGKIEWDSLNYKMFLTKGASLQNSSRDLSIKREIASSLIENDPYYKKIFSGYENYWIIYNATDTLIGPLTKQEYITKRKELKIPDDLQLD